LAIDLSGHTSLLKASSITIAIPESHPLIRLANALPWEEYMNLAAEDLKKTTRNGFWQKGRKIKVRMHLGAYLLQNIYNFTDRKVEYQIKDNAAFQLFCGSQIVDGWHAPDHTKIEEFRNRLSPETQRTLANFITKTAVSFGFGDPGEVDFDSTVQEAGIAYPADANMMCKLAGLGKKLSDYMQKNLPSLGSSFGINLKMVKKKAREYFFLQKNKAIEIKREIFRNLHRFVKKQMRPVVEVCEKLTVAQIKKLPWNIRRAYTQIKTYGWRYLLDVAHFTRNHTIKVGKVLSFHAQSVACINKGKVGRALEFGRVFQLGRIKGNFLFALKSTDILMSDKKNFIPLLEEHSFLFGSGVNPIIASDKGYWSAKNRQALTTRNLSTAGMQQPASIKMINHDIDAQERLRCRRSGIEPLIGHAKHGGQLGRSRMKSDQATLAAGYGSILGLNLRQLIRHQQGKYQVAA
jgi:transposase, IS5 family